MYLGIDLGTTYSVGAYINNMGTPEVVLNSESERITPSVVYFESADSVIVGQTAKENIEIYPQNVISLVKNKMGKDEMIPTEFGEFTPEYVSSKILRKIVDDANLTLNPSEPIKDVVVTVPAYFKGVHRQATKDAAKLAGLNVLSLVNEPTAAAFFYADKYKMDKGRVLIYDFGGGTFDVTIVEIKGKHVEVIGTGGQLGLGGSFIDQMMVDELSGDLLAEHGIDLKTPDYIDVYKELLVKCEKAKIQLSTALKATISYKAGSVRKTVEFTRERLEPIVDKLYFKTEQIIKAELEKKGLGVGDIDKVILVGGSSKIPYVENGLTNLFGKDPSHEVNPNEVVALGAALYAKYVQEEGISEVEITDVNSHGIGIRAYKDGKPYNDIIIPSNTPIPAECTKHYRTGSDGNNTIGLAVYEGNKSDLRFVSMICETIINLPEGLAGGVRVDITLQLDKEQILHLFVTLPENDNLQTEVKIDRQKKSAKVTSTDWKKAEIKEEVKKPAESEHKSTETEKKGFFGKMKDSVSSIFGADKSSDAVAASDTATAGATNGIGFGLGAKSDKKEKKEDKSKRIPKLVEETMSELIGFKSLKEKMRDYYNRYEYENRRAQKLNTEANHDLNILITGEKGFGKSTAAMTAALIAYKIGASSIMNPVVVGYEDLVGTDEQAIQNNVTNFLQQAQGGVLVIDDLHKFYSSTSNAGDIILDIIAKAWNSTKDVIIIAAGNKEDVDNLLKRRENEAFKDLFKIYKIDLEGFTPDEYVQLLHDFAERQLYVVDDEANDLISRNCKGEMAIEGFDGIHHVETILENAIVDLSNKVMNKRRASKEDMMILRRENFNIQGGAKTLEELLEELDSLTGLGSVKQFVHELVRGKQAELRMVSEGHKINSRDTRVLHMVFAGNAGTGKTTVARLVGEILKELGVLTRGQFVECDKSDLVGQYLGETEQKTKAKVNEAMGGILFIDEAYKLAQDDAQGFGKKAIEELLKPLEDKRDEFVCIIAGYTKDMKEFLDANQGLSSRFPHQNWIEFEDYTLDEMVKIFNMTISHRGYMLEEGMEEIIRLALGEISRSSDDFGNARGVRNFAEKVIGNMKVRISKMDEWGPNETVTLRKEDVGELLATIEKPKTIEEILEELNAMTGLHSVKKRVSSIVNQMKINKMRGITETKMGTQHMVFAGNPGTGKTTVARMIGLIYKELGVLTRGQVVECGKADLVGSYVGETAPKVEKKVKEAMGGVLFIDEAYTLSDKTTGGFGQEAIDTLLKQLEDNGDKFICIIAGYSNKMDEFLASNDGLKSRFKNMVEFEDYTAEELVSVFEGMLHNKSLVGTRLECEKEALPLLKTYFEKMRSDVQFANARGARNTVFSCKEVLDDRINNEMLANPTKVFTQEELNLITVADVIQVTGKNKSRSLEELLNELDSLTGLDSVKRFVHDLVKSKQTELRMQASGQKVNTKDSRTLHMVFAGNAGTGKTTVARLVGEILKELGVLPRGQFVECDKSDLIGQYVGETEQKTRSKIDAAMGGILFIDEAYKLVQDDNSGYGKKAVEELLKPLEDRRDEFVCIIAGYTKDMKQFLDANQGLSSRFPHQNWIEFEDYNADEMLQIFKITIARRGYVMEDGMDDIVRSAISELARTSDDFGNARGVRNFADKVIGNMKVRIGNMDEWGPDETITLRKADIGEFLTKIEKPKSIDDILAELNAMTGLNSVKNRVNSIINQIKINKLRGITNSSLGAQHMVFAGNPGTGKTTVARMLGQIYKELGVLPKGHVVECSKADLVAQYVGQTAPLTEKKIQEAYGGILFIDEAYTLVDKQGTGGFGQEAIDTLLKQLEDHSNEFVCIIAGYTNKMEEFLASNDGLKSRFKNMIDFEDYTADELVSVFMGMLHNTKLLGTALECEEAALPILRDYFDRMRMDIQFANARGARNTVFSCKEALDNRINNEMMQNSSKSFTAEELNTITVSDVQRVVG